MVLSYLFNDVLVVMTAKRVSCLNNRVIYNKRSLSLMVWFLRNNAVRRSITNTW